MRQRDSDCKVPRHLLPFAVVSVLHVSMACSNSAPAPAPAPITKTTITGMYAGRPVPTTDSVGLYGVNTAAGTYAGAIITNVAGACPLFQSTANPMTAGIDPPNTTQLNIRVDSLGSSPVPPGTYPVVHSYTDMYQLKAGMELTDAACANLPATSDAADGTVTLSTVTSTMVTGRFDLTFPSGDHLTGEFPASVCNFDLHALVQNGLTGCGSADGGTD